MEVTLIPLIIFPIDRVIYSWLRGQLAMGRWRDDAHGRIAGTRAIRVKHTVEIDSLQFAAHDGHTRPFYCVRLV